MVAVEMEKWSLLADVLLLSLCFIIGSPASVFALLRLATKKELRRRVLVMNMVCVTLIVSLIITPCHLMVMVTPFFQLDLHNLANIEEHAMFILQMSHLITLFFYNIDLCVNADTAFSCSSTRRLVFGLTTVLISWIVGSSTLVVSGNRVHLGGLWLNSTFTPCASRTNLTLESGDAKARQTADIVHLVLCVLILCLYLTILCRRALGNLCNGRSKAKREPISMVHFSQKRRRHTIVGIGTPVCHGPDINRRTFPPSRDGQQALRSSQIGSLDVHEEVSESSISEDYVVTSHRLSNADVILRTTFEREGAELYMSHPLAPDVSSSCLEHTKDVIGRTPEPMPLCPGRLQAGNIRTTSTNSFCSSCVCSLDSCSRSKSLSRSLSDASIVTQNMFHSSKRHGCVCIDMNNRDSPFSSFYASLPSPDATDLQEGFWRRHRMEDPESPCVDDDPVFNLWSRAESDLTSHRNISMRKPSTLADITSVSFDSFISDAQPILCKYCRGVIRRQSNQSIETFCQEGCFNKESLGDEHVTPKCCYQNNEAPSSSALRDRPMNIKRQSIESSDRVYPIQIRIIRPSRVSGNTDSCVSQKPVRRSFQRSHLDLGPRDRRTTFVKGEARHLKRRWSDITSRSRLHLSRDENERIVRSNNGATDQRNYRQSRALRRHRSMSHIGPRMDSPVGCKTKRRRSTGHYARPILVQFIFFLSCLSYSITSLPHWVCSESLIIAVILSRCAVHVWHLLVPFLFVFFLDVAHSNSVHVTEG